MEEIKVNKQCIISQDQHFKGHWADEVILNVSAVDDSDGFVQLVLAYDTDQDCCEQCEHQTEIDDKTPFEVFIEKIEIDTESDMYNEFEDNDFKEWGLDAGGCISFKVYTENGIIKGYVANSQNGYYGHTVEWTLDHDKLETKYFEETI